MCPIVVEDNTWRQWMWQRLYSTPVQPWEVVWHAAVSQVRDGMAQGGELPVQHSQHMVPVLLVQHQVVEPAHREGWGASKSSSAAVGFPHVLHRFKSSCFIVPIS